jgi:hypothetical protein
MKTKARKYFLVGLLVDGLLLLAGIIVIMLFAAANYDGKCGLGLIFGSGRHPCSKSEYVWETTVLLVAVAVVYGWWLLLPLLALPPLAGYLVGRKRAAL